MTDIKTPWNPSQRATKRVKDRLPAPETCRFCDGEVTIEENSKIYNGRTYGSWPWIYYCSGCHASVGIHPYTNIPLGTLADSKTKTARKNTKAKFQEYMDNFDVSRNQAYEDLAAMMDIDKTTCHFGWFDVDDCMKAEEALIRMLDGETPPKPINNSSPFACLKSLLK